MLKLLMCMLWSSVSILAHTVRLKDIVTVEGVRDNLLVGYGLVVGLPGTGDSLAGSPFTRESLVSMLERLGVNTRDHMRGIQTKNVAAVMVTGYLPAFGRQGSKIDVQVSAMGDAKNLQGGTLLVTPLMAADGEVYAIAQGVMNTKGFQAKGRGASVVKNIPTAGSITGGGIIEKETPFVFNDKRVLRLALKNPDFTTAQRIGQKINHILKQSVAVPLDASTISVHIPKNLSAFQTMARIEGVPIQPDTRAKIILDPHSGTIVITQDVRILPVAIAHGGLTINITHTPQVVQPAPFSRGTTRSLEEARIEVEEGEGNMAQFSGPSLKKLVQGMNALGVPVQDMMAIFQALKSAGALQGDVEIRG